MCTKHVCETDVLTFRSRRTIKSPTQHEPLTSRNYTLAFPALNAVEHMYYGGIAASSVHETILFAEAINRVRYVVQLSATGVDCESARTCGSARIGHGRRRIQTTYQSICIHVIYCPTRHRAAPVLSTSLTFDDTSAFERFVTRSPRRQAMLRTVPFTPNLPA